MSRDEVTELAEYGQHFHQNNDDLRRDWQALPVELIEPGVDEALRVAAQSSLALHPLAAAALDDPALVIR